MHQRKLFHQHKLLQVFVDFILLRTRGFYRVFITAEQTFIKHYLQTFMFVYIL